MDQHTAAQQSARFESPTSDAMRVAIRGAPRLAASAGCDSALAPDPAHRCGRGVPGQNKCKAERQAGADRKGQAFVRQVERRLPAGPCCSNEVGVGVSQQPGQLSIQVRVERVHGFAQACRGIDHLLDGITFLMERRVDAGAVMPDQGVQAAAEIVLCNLLERREIPDDLVQAAADALTILRHETRHAAAGQDRRHEYDAVEQAADQTHRGLRLRQSAQDRGGRPCGCRLPSAVCLNRRCARIASDLGI